MATIICLVVICLSLFIGFENKKIIPNNPAANSHYLSEPNNTLKYTSNWDGPIYLRIAKNGYSSKGLSNFFPLYPSLVHIVNLFISSTLYSALLISWISFIGAVYFFIKIVRIIFNLRSGLSEPLKAVHLFIFYPSAFFLLVTYTEALFAFLALASIYLVLEKKYWLAIIPAVLMSATHVNGLFVIILMAIMMWEQKVKYKQIILVSLLSCLGFVFYLFYLHFHFHNFLTFFSAQSAHSKIHLSPSYIAHNFISRNGAFALLTLASTIYWWKKKLSFAVYSLLYLSIIFIGGHGLSGFARYSLVIFPIQFMIYDVLKKRSFYFSYTLIIFTVFWSYMMLQYFGGYTGG